MTPKKIVYVTFKIESFHPAALFLSDENRFEEAVPGQLYPV